MLNDSLNALQFYNIIAPIVAYSKEDHCDISVSGEVSQFLKEKGKFIPLTIVNLNQKPYIIHNADSRYEIDGWELTAVNGKPINDIYHHIFNTFAADGHILSSKYRYLDSTGFAKEYARTIDQPDTIQITAIHPKTHQKKNFTLKTIGFNQLKAEAQALYKQGILKSTTKPANLKTDGKTAILAINTFSNSNYEEAKMDFKKFIKESFETIQKSGIENLIIDMRENGGGTEGNEDFLFSFLTDKPYNKYKYVQASALHYSFYQYTDYKDKTDYMELENDLNKEHYKTPDGRILRKTGIETPEPLQKNPFKGKVYVLTSGWTYSGGAEFCSLMKEHTNAIFIGEEVGGGFYGNTSGYSFTLTLPNTKTEIEIPLLKFVLDVKKNIPKGRGVIPDYEVQPTMEQFMNGKDIEMELAKKMIKNPHHDINY